MLVQKLKIDNFKSIKHLTLECKRINIFIGEPNTGKSNLLETIGFLSHGYKEIRSFLRFENMMDLFYDHILENPIRISFNEESVNVQFSEGRFVASYFKIPDESGQLFFNYNYHGDGNQWDRKELSDFKFYRFTKQEDFPNRKSEFLNPPDGDNLLAVILTRKELRKLLKDIFGKFGYRTVFKPPEGRIEIQKEFEDIVISFPYSLVSETLQRLVFYLTAIYSNKDSILAFEEPESHAFPYYTKFLAERISIDKNNNQYFISTHNPYFLMSVLEKTPKDEVATFLTYLENYQTKVKTLTERQKEKILEMGLDVFFNVEKLLH